MRPALEVAQVIEQFLPQIPTQDLTVHHRRTLQAIRACRTAELGAHIDACDQCGHLRISYNSCRNRHCPKCQGLNKEMWTIQQEDQLLPTAYFHVVFTLPHQLNGLCLHNPRFMYDLLLRAAWYTINTFAADPKWLGAKTAATMVLHTWGQTLVLHPHVHCIVPNGGLTSDGQWQLPKRGKDRFLYPVQAMKKVFKAFFLKQMRLVLEIMTLSGLTFLKRFCLHILPPRFRKVRQYGFLANACKARDIALARKALGLKNQQLLDRAQRKALAKQRLFKLQADRCPCCQMGKMIIVDIYAPNKDPPKFIPQLKTS